MTQERTPEDSELEALLDDLYQRAVDTAPELRDALRSQGYSIVKDSELERLRAVEMAARDVTTHHFGVTNHYAKDAHRCWVALRSALGTGAEK